MQYETPYSRRVTTVHRWRHLSNPARGYLLLVIILVLFAASLTLLLSRLDERNRQASESRQTAHVLHIAQEALTGYATTFRERNPADGFAYLPCPDLEADDGIANFIGTEAGNCGSKDALTIGLLPYNTLGLPELRDSEGHCLWYAVSGTHKNHPRPDILNWDTRSSLIVQDEAGNALESDSGAAAIVFAPGAPLKLSGNEQSDGRSNVAKPCQTDSSHASAYLESLASPFIHGMKKEASGKLISNDRLAWLSSRALFSNITRRPDFAAYLNQHLVLLNQALLEKWPDAASDQSLPDITLSAAELAALSSQNRALYLQWKAFHPAGSSAESFYLQWRNQFRYFKCPVGNPNCYNTQANAHCKGVLLWSGSGIDNAAHWASNVALQQSRGVNFNPDEINAPPGSPRASVRRQLRDYFEDALAFSLQTTQPFIPNPRYVAATPEKDLAFCLGTTIDDLAAFQVRATQGTSAIRLRTLTQIPPGSSATQLLIGDPTSNATLYGCAWHPEALLLSKGLRVYFRLNIQQHGAGFTFTLADASTHPGISMCGAGGSALGYAGDNLITAPIHPPKLAVEFDTHRDATRQDPINAHAAFVFWAGASRSANLDNTHGECAPGNVPCNPTALPGLGAQSALDENQAGKNVYARIDIVPIAPASPQRYVLTAYITGSEETVTACALDNLDADAICPEIVPLQQTLPTTMALAYLGFTMGQDATSGTQQTLIDNFKAKGR